MARASTSGFETNDFTATEWSLVSGATIVTSPVYTGTYAAKVVNTSQLFRGKLATGKTSGTLFVRWYFQISALPASDPTEGMLRTENNGANYAARVTILASGKIQLKNVISGTTATTTAAISTSTWYRAELRHLIAASGGAMELGLYLGDSTTAIESLLINNENTLATQVISWNFSGQGAGNLIIDDVAVNDESGSFQNSWPGPGRVELMVPSSDAAVAWTKAGSTPAATNYGGVDDEPGTPNDGTDYNSDSGTTHVDQFGITALPAEVPSDATMVLMDVYGRVGGDGTTARTITFKVWDNAGTGTAGPSVSTAVNGWKIVTSAEHQVASLAGKTKANVNAYNIGYVAASGSNRNKYVTSLWANVEWKPSVSGDLAVTDTPDTLAGTGTVDWKLSLAASESPDVCAASATISAPAGITGDLAVTDGQDAAALQATVEWLLALAASESPDVASASATVSGGGPPARPAEWIQSPSRWIN